MFKATIKNLLGHKLRVAITALAIIAGVSFMSGTFVLTDTVTATFDDLFADVNQGVDAVVRQQSAYEVDQGPGGPGGEQRDDLPIELVDTIAAQPDVAAAEASVQGLAIAIGKDGKPINPVNGAPQFGGNWQTVAAMTPYALAEGAAPVGATQAVVDRGTAERGELAVGDPFRVQTANATLDLTVSGIATVGGKDNFAGASFVLMETAAATEAFGQPGKTAAIIVEARDGVSQDQLADSLAGALPVGVEAITGEDFTAEQQDIVQSQLSTFSTVLNGFAGVALVAGAFLIYNIFGIVVAQRTKELALLRALGASRVQVRTSVLIEAFVTGLVASLLGLLAGIGLAIGLTALLNAIGLDTSGTAPVVAPRTVVVSLIVGLVITMLSALLPAWRASRVSPMAAIRDVAVDDSGRSLGRVVIGTVLTVLGSLALLGGSSGQRIAPILIGVVLLFGAVVVLGPRLAPAVTRVLGAWLPRVRGLVGRLARDNAVRNPKRTASTATALVLALTLVGILTIFTSSFTATINAAVVEGFKGDYQIDSGGFGVGGLSPQLAASAKALPEVEAVAGLQIGTASLIGDGITIWGTDGPDLPEVLDIGVNRGSLDELVGTDTIAVSSGTLEFFDLQLGSNLTLGFPSGQTHPFRIVATYTEAGLLGQGAEAQYLISREAFAAFEPAIARSDLRVMVKGAPGVDKAALRSAIEGLLDDYPTAKVRSLDEIQEAQTAQINQVLSFVLVLLALSVFIGFLGIAITLALSVIERTRELGLLRALGMDRRAMKSMVRWEAVLIALLGTTLGLGLGVLGGVALSITAVGDLDTATISIPVVRLLMFAVAAALFGVVAAIFPARRAAKLDVLRAISVE